MSLPDLRFVESFAGQMSVEIVFPRGEYAMKLNNTLQTSRFPSRPLTLTANVVSADRPITAMLGTVVVFSHQDFGCCPSH